MAYLQTLIKSRTQKFSFVVPLILALVFIWRNWSTTTRLFGSPCVNVASTLHLISSLGLNSKPCRLNENRTIRFRYLDVEIVCQRREEKCFLWHWDVANWTLIYTNQQMYTSSHSTVFCPVPIHGLRTAKIVHSNGTVNYPGCVNSRYPCSQTMDLFYPFYDKKLQMRINRSPCCRKLIVDMSQHITRVFDKNNITYFYVGGVVISLVRDEGKYIPYDMDTDLAVDYNDINKVIQAFPELEKPGYIFKWLLELTNGDKRYMIGCTNSKCRTGPGIALYSVKNGTVSVPLKGYHSLPVNLTLPPIRRIFEGEETSFPRDPEKYLDYAYGKDKWRTPMNCTKLSSQSYGKCVV